MSEITGLEPVRKGEKQVRVFLDGKFAFTLGARLAVKEGLRIGQELPDERIQALAKAEQLRRCLDAAVRFLSYRPRSEAEIRQRLAQRRFDAESIEAVLAKLREQKLIDDVAFAQYWAENRESFSPRSSRLTGLELRKKGVNGNVIGEAIGAIDDGENAYRAAQARARRLPATDYPTFKRRLGEYLRRRGFSYEIASRTAERLWRESGAGEPASTAGES